MRLTTDRGLFHFGVASALGECLTISGEDRSWRTTTAVEREPDSLQLRAAERLGLFPYGDTTHPDSVKDQAA